MFKLGHPVGIVGLCFSDVLHGGTPVCSKVNCVLVIKLNVIEIELTKYKYKI